MTCWLSRAVLFFAVWAAAAGWARAQGGAGLIDQTVSQRYGVVRGWLAHVHVDSAADRLESIHQHTNFKDVYIVFEVRTPDGARIAYSARDLGVFGRPLGEAGAKARAELRQKMFADDGIEATVIRREIPQIGLFAQTRRGVIHAIDGETGRTLWSRQVGDSRFPTTPAAANDDFVAVLNGSTLHVLERGSGKPVWERRVGGAPGTGPALGSDFVAVVTVSGRVEAYQLASPKEQPWTYHSLGQVGVQPVSTGRSIAWPTDRGYLYVIRGNTLEPAMRYRLEARGNIVAPASYRFPMLYAASQDGYVYAMHELAGGTQWRFSSGLPIDEQPAAVGEAVYVFPKHGGVFALNARNGQQLWWAPRGARFLAASENKVYVTDAVGNLIILDAATGHYRGQIDASWLPVRVVNQQNDRIFLASQSGLVQCLHEAGLPKPLVYGTSEIDEEELPADQRMPSDPAIDPADDPFADFGDE